MAKHSPEANQPILKKENGFAKYFDQDIRLWKQKDYAEGTNYQIGIQSYRSKQYSEAIKAFKKHLNKHPQHSKTLKVLALAFMQVGDKGQAIEAQKKLIDLTPEDPGAHFDLATLYADSKSWKKSVFHMGFAESLFRQRGDLVWANLAREQSDSYSRHYKN